MLHYLSNLLPVLLKLDPFCPECGENLVGDGWHIWCVGDQCSFEWTCHCKEQEHACKDQNPDCLCQQ